MRNDEFVHSTRACTHTRVAEVSDFPQLKKRKKVKFFQKRHQHFGVEIRYLFWKRSYLAWLPAYCLAFTGFGNDNLVDFQRLKC